ncbi:MAG: thermonuclease family protein [Desulfosalsimonas sp.]
MLHRIRLTLSFLVLIVAALLLIPATASAWSGQVVHVADSDTITALRNGEKVRIRLYGIDTPESDQPFCSRAERFAEEIIGNNYVEIVQ